METKCEEVERKERESAIYCDKGSRHVGGWVKDIR